MIFWILKPILSFCPTSKVLILLEDLHMKFLMLKSQQTNSSHACLLNIKNNRKERRGTPSYSVSHLCLQWLLWSAPHSSPPRKSPHLASSVSLSTAVLLRWELLLKWQKQRTVFRQMLWFLRRNREIIVFCIPHGIHCSPQSFCLEPALVKCLKQARISWLKMHYKFMIFWFLQKFLTRVIK